MGVCRTKSAPHLRYGLWKVKEMLILIIISITIILLFVCVRLYFVRRQCKKYHLPYKKEYFWYLPQAYEQITNRNRGAYGELQLVNMLLNAGFKTTAVYHDLYVPKKNGQTAQIDVVLCTNIGLVVFEVKDYSGWIFGKGTQQNWTQITKYGNCKYRFYNPILQNAGHIQALKQLPLLKNVPMYSMIVFFGGCILKDVSQFPENVSVEYGCGNVLYKIKELLTTKEEYVYSDRRTVANTLNNFVRLGDDLSVRQQHNEYVEYINKEKIS